MSVMFMVTCVAWSYVSMESCSNVIIICVTGTLLHLFLQALDSALKQVAKQSANTAAMFFSTDPDAGKIFCLCAVPKVSKTFMCMFYLHILY